MIHGVRRGIILGAYLGSILGAILVAARTGLDALGTGLRLEYEVVLATGLVEAGSLGVLGAVLGGLLGFGRAPLRGVAGLLLPGSLVLILLGARVGLGFAAQASTRANRLPVKADEPLVFAIAFGATLVFHFLLAPSLGRAIGRRPQLAAVMGLVALGAVAAPAVLAFTGRVAGNSGFQVGEVSRRWALPAAPITGPEERPNIVIVTMDSLRPDYLGAYGNTIVKTPNLDRLAQEAAVFTGATTVQPTTLPTHLSLFSGVYPATHGGRDHIGSLLPDRFDTLPMVLKAAGYRTAGFYSYIGLRPEYSNLQRGFDVYEDMTQGLPPHMANPVVGQTSRLLKRLLDEVPLAKIAEDAAAATTGLEEQLWDRAELATDAALAWLRGGQASPFFLWVHYFDPHYPYAAPPPYDRLYDSDYTGPFDGDWATIRFLQEGGQPGPRDLQHIRAAYAGEVTYVDLEVGRLLQQLRDTELWDRTLVVVLADHGQALGEGGQWFHNASVSQVMVAIPLLLSYPPLIAPTIVSTPVQTIDVMPTVLDAIGIKERGRLEGKSLLPLAGGADGSQQATVVERADRTLVAIRQANWKLVFDRASGERFLYDLGKDLEETWDYAAQQPEVVQRLQGILEEWWRAHP